jgi:hypothetical protein
MCLGVQETKVLVRSRCWLEDGGGLPGRRVIYTRAKFLSCPWGRDPWETWRVCELSVFLPTALYAFIHFVVVYFQQNKKGRRPIFFFPHWQ